MTARVDYPILGRENAVIPGCGSWSDTYLVVWDIETTLNNDQ